MPEDLADKAVRLYQLLQRKSPWERAGRGHPSILAKGVEPSTTPERNGCPC
jgi:hypothetical protein